MSKVWRQAGYLAVAAAFAAGCSAAPTERTSTMTGRIHDIHISDRINPEEIQVHIGDEVRWVNARSAPIKVVFIDPLKEYVSCQNGFVTGRFSQDARATNITTIDANEFASLCFSAPGLYRYTARMESPLPGGEKNESGTVRVIQ